MRLTDRKGVTLAELMVAMAIMSIGVIGIMASFAGIQKGIQLMKNKTLASNLAQEKMHILKQKPYYQVIPTPNPSGENTNYSPSIPYDTVYFPVETILQGGLSYQRLTYIQVARENSGTLELLAPETPDTGMRLITITVLWLEGGQRKKLSINSVLANPDTVMASAVFTGKVQINGTTTGISGALVNVAENMGWRDTANASGDYSVTLSPGSFTLMASAPGYYNKFVLATAVAGASTTQDFDMVAIASGTVSGAAWLNPGLVISQVVASSSTQIGDGSTQYVEYVELFNPTTYSINIGVSGGPKSYYVDYLDEDDASVNCPGTDPGETRCDFEFFWVHITSHVPPNKSYLLASASYFMILGQWITADAYYPGITTNPGYINEGEAGAIRLVRVADSAVVDVVGWEDDDNDAPSFEGTQIPDPPAYDGMGEGNQIVRLSSPSADSSSFFGKAYDSDSNQVDFLYPSAPFSGISHRPFGTTDSTQTVIAGAPAVGAIVSAIDGLSDPTTAYLAGNPPSAVFSLINVATGTWTVILSSGQYLLQNDTVTLTTTGSVYTFPSSTTRLNQTALYGFISGVVTGITGSPISAPSAIAVSPGAAGSNQNANTSNGRYFLVVSTGSVDVTANPSNANASYVSVSSSAVSVSLGQISNGVDFVLSQGGRISGFITRDGTNALPGVAIAAIDANSISRDQQVSDANGRFTTVNIATGTYEVTPSIDSLETSSPTYKSVTVTAGQTVSAGTFTISGALGTISGTVATSAGAPIATGVLIVVTTGTLSGTPPAPPALSSATLTGAPYYIASSLEDGTYNIEVRESTNPVYNIYAYYTTIASDGSVSITAKTRTAGVLAGQTTSTHNLTW